MTEVLHEYKGSRSLSKKKYYALEEELMKRYDESIVEDVLNILKDVLKFDPGVSLYTEDAKRSILERRERLKAQGISTYVSCGAKAYYERSKQKKST